MLHGAIVLDALARRDEAMASYDRVIRRFGRAQDTQVRMMLAWAQVYKAAVLSNAGRHREAIAIYESLLPRLRHIQGSEVHRTANRNLEIARARLVQSGKAVAGKRPRMPGGMIRLLGALGIIAAVVTVSSIASFVAYHDLPLGRGPQWLVEPNLYLQHVEHAVDLLPRLLNLLIPTLVVMFVITSTGPWPIWTGVVIALGGRAANLAQLAVTGSVTDFVGIHRVGILSAGDIAVYVGSGLFIAGLGVSIIADWLPRRPRAASG
jgi:hypothetical protein